MSIKSGKKKIIFMHQLKAERKLKVFYWLCNFQFWEKIAVNMGMKFEVNFVVL